MIDFLKKKKWLVVSILVILFVIFNVFGKGDDGVEYVTQDASYESITQYVSVTGTVEATQQVDLRFETNGEVDQISTFEGDDVVVGESLITLDRTSDSIDLLRTQAGVDLAQAELDLLYAGATNEDIRISQAQIDEASIQVTNAEKELSNVKLINVEQEREADLNVETSEAELASAEISYNNTVSTEDNDATESQSDLDDAYADAQTVVSSTLDEIQASLETIDDFLGVDGFQLDGTFDTLLLQVGTSTRSSLKVEYSALREQYDDWVTEYGLLGIEWDSADSDALDTFIEELRTFTGEVKNHVDEVYSTALIVNTSDTSTLANLTIIRTSLESAQGDLNTDLASLENAVQAVEGALLALDTDSLSGNSSLSSADAALISAQNALSIAESQLQTVQVQNEIDVSNAESNLAVLEVRLDQAVAEHDRLIANPRNEEVSQLQAKLNQARANYQDAWKGYQDTVLTAPSSGVVTNIAFEVGENVTSSEVVLSMITDKLQIKANISETEISKVEVGDKVDITFDAFSLSEHFEGEVVAIDPAETVIQGVVYYEARILFDGNDKSIRSGMTANIDIISDQKESALTIPPQALQYEDGIIHVYVLQGSERIRRDLMLGLEGNDLVEVVDGLSDGDEVILYEKR
jgi:multidrug resistance efflux pump